MTEEKTKRFVLIIDEITYWKPIESFKGLGPVVQN